jgi:hypothetical protein
MEIEGIEGMVRGGRWLLFRLEEKRLTMMRIRCMKLIRRICWISSIIHRVRTVKTRRRWEID